MKPPRLPLLFLLGCLGAIGLRAQSTYNIQNVTYTAGMGLQNVGYFPGSGLIDEIRAGSSVVVDSGANVTYAPGATVRLLPGFHAVTGSRFNAFIFDGFNPTNPGGPGAPTWTNVTGRGWFMVGQTGRFTFRAFDPDGDLRFLQIAWRSPSGTNSSGWIDIGSNQFQSSLESNIVFTEAGAWTVWVRAKDAASHVRDPDAQSITVEQKSVLVGSSLPVSTGLKIHRPTP